MKTLVFSTCAVSIRAKYDTCPELSETTRDYTEDLNIFTDAEISGMASEWKNYHRKACSIQPTESDNSP